MSYTHVEWMTTGFASGVMERNRGTETSRVETRPQEEHVVNLYPQHFFQEFHGFGTAITEAAGSVLNSMPRLQSERILDDCFGETGLGYSWVRVPIDSCDFALSPYSSFGGKSGSEAVDEEIFSDHDRRYIIPWLKEAQARLDVRRAGPLKLCMVAWSPPAFMKSNGDRNGGGTLLPEFRGSWARYLCRYLQAYEKEGFPVSYLGVQNEPSAAQLWDSCLYSAEEEKDFLETYLRPELARHNLDHVKLSIWDHNREGLFDRVLQICSGPADKHVDAAAFHWYSGDHFEALELVRREFPDLQLIFTEGCVEYKHHSPASQLQHARMYGHHIIGDLNHGANAWLDWNLVLDELGGPNHVGNFCDAPILCDCSTGTYSRRLTWHYLEHFVPWIRPGSRRIGFTRYTSDLELTAWKTPASGEAPGDAVVLVAMNTKDRDIPIVLRCAGRLTDLVIPAESIASVRLS
ncbi:MAG: glucosylceramidase [Spirochaetaceae bacterium]|nr:MAG: glucosylceramidase [Spirochaetaceae bacterium]